jgi:hypothetical protein
MGIEIQVNSLEDMCALMCDNRIPKQKPKPKPEKDQDKEDKTKPRRP